jgi:Zn-finger nucleic acid-binding protein
MSERQGVEIDYCPKCRGVWLDRGELDKIIEKSSAAMDRPDFDDDDDDDNKNFQRDRSKDEKYRQNPNQQRRGRRGFFGDFFDFD